MRPRKPLAHAAAPSRQAKEAQLCLVALWVFVLVNLIWRRSVRVRCGKPRPRMPALDRARSCKLEHLIPV